MFKKLQLAFRQCVEGISDVFNKAEVERAIRSGSEKMIGANAEIYTERARVHKNGRSGSGISEPDYPLYSSFDDDPVRMWRGPCAGVG